ncbi:phBC6A51 family helix-turn-helix protein [Lactobacillus amylovorus]|uniref:phBC6A51 family helix-turn-helix protein n=1 Tax=Lactobacillus amylovorus TaxID=1604 RepID=UPI0023307375|nr:phBC6A51 family helix-turn-helix protein [Lactobacillus amylovorus]MDB6267252.1 phBC6A51 family helix-turn-helix protein [Lactobacillus amylovorus]
MTKRQRNIVRMLFLGDLTDEEIAKRASCSRSTITRLKRDPNFIQAQQEYAIYQLDHSLPQSVSQLLNLINNSKSDMVKLQAIQTVLKHANLLSDNSTPELDKARIRKANADARVAEARAKAMEDNGQDMEQLLDKMLDTLTKEDKKNGNN